MIKVIGGSRGSGKTKKIIAHANDALDVCKGNIVYVTDTASYSREINMSIRFINISEYIKPDYSALKGFIAGIIASNTDVGKIYIDGLTRILGADAADMEEFFLETDALSEKHNVDFVISVTYDQPPKFIKKYL